MGGTSSLAPEIYKLASESGYEIHATHRRANHPKNRQSICWRYLNLGSKESIDEFLSELGGLTFSRIIYLAGATCGRVGQEISTNDVSVYLTVQLLHPIYLIKRLVNLLDVDNPSNLIYMSSRAAIFGSADWPYGIAKAGIQNFVSSISQSLSPPSSVFSVASGLIAGSRMQNEMDSSTLESHIARANKVGGRLLSLEDIASELWELDPRSTPNFGGMVKFLGPVY